MRTRLAWFLTVGAVTAATALLFGAGTAAAATWTVNCPSGDLQNTIDNLANPGDTIVINGTCYGNFLIDSLGFAPTPLTLQGGSPGATLNGRRNDSTLKIFYDNVTIRNLTITNGSALEGGGIELGTATLSMTNSTVKGNRADFGGGIWADESSLDLTGVTVTKNTATYSGGGIYLFFSEMSLTASTVSKNETTQAAERYGGGGIWLQASDALLTSTKVTANTSGDYGGGIADYGFCRANGTPVNQQPLLCDGDAGTASGALRAAPAVFSPGLTLVNSSVDHNIAADDGGGIYNVSADGDSPIVLDGSTVSFNKASDGDGGGIANYGECGNTASVLATKSTFQGNLAKAGDGGAVYNSAGEDGCGEAGTGLVTIAQSPAANGPNVVNANQAQRGGGFANEQDDGVASLTLQPGATVKGNKASVTGGGVWNNCGSFSSLGQIFLNTPNNVVSTCVQVVV